MTVHVHLIKSTPLVLKLNAVYILRAAILLSINTYSTLISVGVLTMTHNTDDKETVKQN